MILRLNLHLLSFGLAIINWSAYYKNLRINFLTSLLELLHFRLQNCKSLQNGICPWAKYNAGIASSCKTKPNMYEYIINSIRLNSIKERLNRTSAYRNPWVQSWALSPWALNGSTFNKGWRTQGLKPSNRFLLLLNISTQV